MEALAIGFILGLIFGVIAGLLFGGQIGVVVFLVFLAFGALSAFRGRPVP